MGASDVSLQGCQNNNLKKKLEFWRWAPAEEHCQLLGMSRKGLLQPLRWTKSPSSQQLLKQEVACATRNTSQLIM